jgi:hypothetical protein
MITNRNGVLTFPDGHTAGFNGVLTYLVGPGTGGGGGGGVAGAATLRQFPILSGRQFPLETGRSFPVV